MGERSRRREAERAGSARRTQPGVEDSRHRALEPAPEQIQTGREGHACRSPPRAARWATTPAPWQPAGCRTGAGCRGNVTARGGATRPSRAAPLRSSHGPSPTARGRRDSPWKAKASTNSAPARAATAPRAPRREPSGYRAGVSSPLQCTRLHTGCRQEPGRRRDRDTKARPSHWIVRLVPIATMRNHHNPGCRSVRCGTVLSGSRPAGVGRISCWQWHPHPVANRR